MNRPLLVIAHEATRTGSPRVLLELLRHARGQLSAPVAVQLLAEGPLGEELRSLAQVDHHGARPAAVLVNSAAAASSIVRFDAALPSALYVHEEGDALAVLPADCVEMLPRYDTVMCVSDRSRDRLIAMGVTAERIVVLPPVVAPPSLRPTGPTVDAASTAPLLIGCGEAGWRKGADLFVDVARRVDAQRPVRFAWAGRRPRAFGRVLDNDTRAVGLDGRLEWLGEVTDVGPLFEDASVLVMTSREDPQPLVPLEAAFRGVATAGFALGGLADLADVGAAEVVPYPDTVALAGAIVELLDDPAARERLADSACRRARDRHSIEVVGHRFTEILAELLERTP